MTQGKQICNLLKDIRKRIAEVNGIELLTSECDYEGECSGSCPKCDEELRYLNELLSSEQRKIIDVKRESKIHFDDFDGPLGGIIPM